MPIYALPSPHCTVLHTGVLVPEVHQAAYGPRLLHLQLPHATKHPLPCLPTRSLFKGLKPLWGRQIPYTMMKFGAFENTVQMLYKHVVPKPKSECTKGEQLGVSFLAGYIAGVFCAVVSHPADNLVSKMNAQKGATASDIIKEMGWYALFTRGLGLRIIMIGTLTGLQWGIYDAFKVWMYFVRKRGTYWVNPLDPW